MTVPVVMVMPSFSDLMPPWQLLDLINNTPNGKVDVATGAV